MTPWRITHLSTTPSTMNWARDAALSGAPDFTGVIADEQTKGRGRQGRVWTSPKGNLYFSFIWRNAPPLLPLALAIALHDALSPLTDDVQVKWPNDVLVGGRKIAGILIEREGDASIVGIGVNVAHAPEGAACLNHDGINTKLFLQRLTTAVDALDMQTVIERWNALAAYKHQPITFKQGAVTRRGVFQGVDENGHAVIREGDAVRRYASGEIMEVRHAADN